MLSKIILAVLAILVVAVLYMKLTAIRVSSSDARVLVENGALLVDVRSEGEYADGGIEGSINIPIQELASRMDELGDKNREIVVYCQSGGRSAMAKRLLESNGFSKVHDLGSINRW
ncbi:MAG: rhodanese-like domain-containing protein [Polyangiales bacterium]|jgi:rhodanese-related sulfurtransferase